MKSPRRELSILVTATLLALLPFVGRPLHVDDPMYVWAGRHIAAGHWADFYGFTVNWERPHEPMWAVMQNPPLTSFYMAAASAVVGWGEVGLHGAFLPLSVLTVVGTYRIAARFCGRPLWAAVLLLGCPGFLVSATTLMADLPLLCPWVWAVVAWTSAADRPAGPGRAWRWWAAGGLAGVAFLAKYPGLNLIPLLALHAVLFPAERWRGRLAQAAALLVPVAVAIAYDRATASVYGHGLLSGAAAYASGHPVPGVPVRPAVRLADGLAFAGGAAVGPAAAAVAVAWSARRWWVVAAVAAAVPVGAVVAWRFAVHPGTWPESTARYAAVADVPPPTDALPVGLMAVEFGLLMAAGVAVAVTAAADPWASAAGGADRRRSLFLLAWAGGVGVFAVGLNWSINVRTLVPALPAACVLAVRSLDRAPRATRPAAIATALAVLASLAVAQADDASARGNRRAVADLLAWHAATCPDRRLFYQGHWEFQHYMDQAGVPIVDDAGRSLRPGDLVAAALDNYGVGGTPGVRYAPAHRVRADVGRFVATMNWPMTAGFYASAGDVLPFSVGLVPPDPFVILRVDAVGLPTTGPAVPQPSR